MAPIFADIAPDVLTVDPVVQALMLTDVVVEAATCFSFSPEGPEVVECVSRTVSDFQQIPRSTGRRRHRVLCRRLCKWHDRRSDGTRP